MMDKKEVFKQFLAGTEVLIVDKNQSSRNRLLKTFLDLGGKKNAIYTTASLTEAEEIIKTKNIGVVLSDYFITGGSGFDLFKMVREKLPRHKDLCLILVTSNISQTAVAKAAEEDVDSFIIKPYTIQSIQDNLISTVVAKISPSEYMQKVDAGKEFIKQQQYDDAINILNEAINLHPKPSLALFYIGQAQYFKKHIGDAQQKYAEGLNFNSIHYKCLVGLFDLFMKEEKFSEAYQIVKKIAKYFPANPDRLAQIIRLAIRTQNYADMQSYYEIFTSLEDREEQLINYIGAGMYIAGKHNLMTDNPDVALQYFDNIAVSCSDFTKFIRAIISVLVEFDMAKDAEKYMSRFPSEANDNADYLISKFLIYSKKLKDPASVIKMGLDLYNKQVRDFTCMQVLLSAMKQKGYQEEKMAPYISEMKTLFPERMSDLTA